MRRRPIEILTFDGPIVKAAMPEIDLDRVWEAPWPTEMVEKSGNVGIYYQEAMANAATTNLCRALSVTTELHYTRMVNIFKATNRPPMKLVVASLSKNHDGTGGGYHNESSGTTLFADVKLDRVKRRYDPAFTSFIFVAEAIQPMAYFNAPSFSDDFDQGEALSRVMAITIMPGQLGPYGVVVKWLNSAARADYSNRITDEYSGPAIGCHMTMLFWWHNKRHLSWERIIAAGRESGLTMEQIHRRLTGESGAYGRMKKDLDKAYPTGKVLEDTEANETIFV